MKQCTDQELVSLLQQGKDGALNELMGRYKHRLYSFVWRYIGEEETVYDIVQETFTKLYFKAHTYKPDYTFSTWLFQIALNLCRDHARQIKDKHLILLNDEEYALVERLASPEPDIINSIEARQLLAKVDVLIKKLPDKLKTAFILFVLEERSQEECAELLGTTPKTIENRVYRARKMISDQLFTK